MPTLSPLVESQFFVLSRQWPQSWHYDNSRLSVTGSGREITGGIYFTTNLSIVYVFFKKGCNFTGQLMIWSIVSLGRNHQTLRLCHWLSSSNETHIGERALVDLHTSLRSLELEDMGPTSWLIDILIAWLIGLWTDRQMKRYMKFNVFVSEEDILFKIRCRVNSFINVFQYQHPSNVCVSALSFNEMLSFKTCHIKHVNERAIGDCVLAKIC